MEDPSPGTNRTKMAAGRSVGYVLSLIPSLLLTSRTKNSACKPNEKLFRILGSHSGPPYKQPLNPLTPRNHINPLSPSINMHLLHTVLHTFLMVLLERICSNITTFHLW